MTVFNRHKTESQMVTIVTVTMRYLGKHLIICDNKLIWRQKSTNKIKNQLSIRFNLFKEKKNQKYKNKNIFFEKFTLKY
jgi:hypothetical protein